MATVTLSSKGQLVIPKQVRTLANISAGDALQVRYLGGEIRLRPIAQTGITTLDGVAGCLANAPRNKFTDAQVRAAIKARLKADDTATMSRAAKPKKSTA
jgi:AbrB family looped-hinge helix DNA binding protein